MSFIDQAKANLAHVFRAKMLIGVISRTRAGSVFTYSPEFLDGLSTKQREKEEGAAFHLPYSRHSTETAGVNLHPYFAGLLPEGLRLKTLIQKVKTSPDDLLSLLIASGSDCIGDISVLPAASPVVAPSSLADLEKLTETSFSELFKQSLLPDGNLDEVNIPGVQDKISASMLSFPIRGTGDHHSYILKLAPFDKPRIIQNEYFFLNMAKDCGLPVNQAKLVRDKMSEEGLLIQRFDRVVINHGLNAGVSRATRKGHAHEVLSIHQEDACQFLNLYPADKYRVSFSEIAKGLQLCSTPILEVGKLLRLKAFSYLIANGDLHAKNVSIFVSPDNGRTELTPAYDLLSTLPYGDQKMALKLDGKDDNLKRKNFVEFGKRFGLREAATLALLDEIYQASLSWIGRLGEIGLSDKKTTQLHKVMLKRREDLSGKD